jgi:hypothetical protein
MTFYEGSVKRDIEEDLGKGKRKWIVFDDRI